MRVTQKVLPVTIVLDSLDDYQALINALRVAHTYASSAANVKFGDPLKVAAWTAFHKQKIAELLNALDVGV